MAENTSPSENDEFYQITSQPDALDSDSIEDARRIDECLACVTNAIKSTDAAVYATFDDDKIDQNFGELCEYTTARNYFDAVFDQLEPSQQTAIEIEAHDRWAHEIMIMSHIGQAVADQRYNSELSPQNRQDLKKLLTATFIVLDVDLDVWIPVVNEALDGEPLDINDPDHRRLIEEQQEKINDSDEYDIHAELEDGLTKILLEHRGAIEELLTISVVVREIIAYTHYVMAEAWSFAKFHDSVTVIVDEYALSNDCVIPILRLCNEYISRDN
ncbi:MAG: hypothetical protein ABIR91_01515 [Candidatus Saccharimonadales bacterium]